MGYSKLVRIASLFSSRVDFEGDCHADCTSLFSFASADVHRFDANAIPLDGPYGLLVHVERLLDGAPGVDQRRKRVLLERFLRVVQDSG